MTTMQYVVSVPTVCIVKAEPNVARLVATAPLLTIRTSDLAEVRLAMEQVRRDHLIADVLWGDLRECLKR